MPEFDVYVGIREEWTVRVTAKSKEDAMSLVDSGEIYYSDNGDYIDRTIDVLDADEV